MRLETNSSFGNFLVWFHLCNLQTEAEVKKRRKESQTHAVKLSWFAAF